MKKIALALSLIMMTSVTTVSFAQDKACCKKAGTACCKKSGAACCKDSKHCAKDGAAKAAPKKG